MAKRAESPEDFGEKFEKMAKKTLRCRLKTDGIPPYGSARRKLKDGAVYVLFLSETTVVKAEHLAELQKLEPLLSVEE